MDDLVRREDVELALLEKGQRSRRYRLGETWELNFTEIREALAEVPSAQPEQRWIPCSERLPSDEYYDETFTVTIQCEHYAGWDDYVTGYADWTPHGWDIQSYYMGHIKVTAWMPLPEPYEEDKQND